MKSLIVLVSLLAVTFGGLSTGNVGVPIAPVKIPVRTGQYRVESANADGSIAGQYGYQTEGQHFQVSYSTASQTPENNNDPTYSSGTGTSTTSEVTTTTDLQTKDTPKTDDTKTATTVVTTVPLPTVNTPIAQPQTYGAYYPTAQLPSYFHVKPVASGYSPIQQQFSYSHSVPYVPVNGQTFPVNYFPNYINGQQYFYPQPTYTYTAGASSGVGTSPVLTGQVSPQVYTAGQTGQVSPQVYTAGQTGQVSPQVYTAGQTGQVSPHLYTTGQTSQVSTAGGVSGFSVQSGATTFPGQGGAVTYAGQGGISPVVQKVTSTSATGQLYSGQQVVAGLSPVHPFNQRGTSGTYSSRYGYAFPTYSYRIPAYSYPGFSQRYGVPRFQYRVSRY